MSTPERHSQRTPCIWGIRAPVHLDADVETSAGRVQKGVVAIAKPNEPKQEFH